MISVYVRLGTNDVVPAYGEKFATFSRRPAPLEERHSTAFKLLIIVHDALVAAHHRPKALSLVYSIL